MAEEYGRQKKRAKPAEDNTYANQDWSQWYNSYNPYSYDQSSSSHMPPPPPPIPMMNPFGDMSGTLWSYYYYGYAMGQYQVCLYPQKRPSRILHILGFTNVVQETEEMRGRIYTDLKNS